VNPGGQPAPWRSAGAPACGESASPDGGRGLARGVTSAGGLPLASVQRGPGGRRIHQFGVPSTSARAVNLNPQRA
jgi:hypothetical protein